MTSVRFDIIKRAKIWILSRGLTALFLLLFAVPFASAKDADVEKTLALIEQSANSDEIIDILGSTELYSIRSGFDIYDYSGRIETINPLEISFKTWKRLIDLVQKQGLVPELVHSRKLGRSRARWAYADVESKCLVGNSCESLPEELMANNGYFYIGRRMLSKHMLLQELRVFFGALKLMMLADFCRLEDQGMSEFDLARLLQVYFFVGRELGPTLSMPRDMAPVLTSARKCGIDSYKAMYFADRMNEFYEDYYSCKLTNDRPACEFDHAALRSLSRK